MLDFYTSEELIKELLKRPTFIGILIKSDQEHKIEGSVHKNWDITYINLSIEQSYSVMKDVTDHFQQLVEK
jgi:hypothetical protein